MSQMGQLAAVLLAAGHSRRMGAPKLVLPWGSTTVIGRVVETFHATGIPEIVVVTGGAREAVETALRGLPARTVFNPRHQEDSMILSLQAGLKAISPGVDAAFVALGDQPQIEAQVIQGQAAAYRETQALLVVPSYHRRRGHPWVLDRSLWSEILSAPSSLKLRDFLQGHADQIHYLPVETASILADLDTPDDYQQALQS